MDSTSTRDDSNGVLQPYKHLGWWKWMYRVTPYTYIVEGLVGQGGASHRLLTCFCTDAVFSGRAWWDHLRSDRIRNHQSAFGPDMPTVPGPVHQ